MQDAKSPHLVGAMLGLALEVGAHDTMVSDVDTCTRTDTLSPSIYMYIVFSLGRLLCISLIGCVNVFT